MTLGIWHPYKQANSVVWSHWGARFLAPYFRHLIPNSDFSALVTIVTYFTYIRLAPGLRGRAAGFFFFGMCISFCISGE